MSTLRPVSLAADPAVSHLAAARAIVRRAAAGADGRPALVPIGPPALPGLPLLADGSVAGALDIVLSTHLTLVVQARLEFDGGRAPQLIHLVLSRAHCRHDRPQRQALLDAVQSALGRSVQAGVTQGVDPGGDAGGPHAAGDPCGPLGRHRPRALSTRIDGRWHALWPPSAAAAGA